MRACAEIMLRETEKHFEQPTSIEKVCFVLWDPGALVTFREVFSEIQTGRQD